jgi:hypothetical protein
MDCRAYPFAQTVHTLHAHHRRRPIQPGTGYRTYQYDISKFDVSKVPKMEAMRAGGSAWAAMQKMFTNDQTAGDRVPAVDPCFDVLCWPPVWRWPQVRMGRWTR